MLCMSTKMAGVVDSNHYQKFGSFYAEPTAMTPIIS